MREDFIPIKITIRKGNVEAGEPAMVYPPGHDAQLIDRLGIGMHYCKSKKIGNGDEVEYALTSLPKDKAEAYKQAAENAGYGGDVEFLSEEDAENLFAVEVEEPEQVMTDRAVIEILVAKKQAGITLTPAELDAFDPDKPARGINRNPRKGFKNKLGLNKVDTQFRRK